MLAMSGPVGPPEPLGPAPKPPTRGRRTRKHWSLRRRVGALFIAIGTFSLIVNGVSVWMTVQAARAVEHQETMLGAGGGRLRAADASVLHDARDVLAVTIGRTGVLLAIFLVLWLLLDRVAFRPLQRLHHDVRAVTEGRLDQPISAQGPIELASLGRDTEAMRRRLQQDVDELRQLRQALDEHSPLEGLVQSELESSDDELELSVAARLLPAEGVLAGDWHDAWAVDSDHVALALVDVSGHGPAAGLMALRIKHLISPPFRMGLSPGEALDWMVDQLGELDERCATAIVVDIDLTTGRCRYANAGHPAGTLVHGRHVTRLPPTGPLISALGGSWATREIQPTAGDLLVLITDGLTEARMRDGTELGAGRLVSLLRTLEPGAAPDEVAERIVSSVRATSLAPLRDDATVVVVRFGPRRRTATRR